MQERTNEEMKFKYLMICLYFSPVCWSQQRDGEYKYSFEKIYAEEIKKAKNNYRNNLATFIKKESTSVEFVLLGERFHPTIEEFEFSNKFFHVGPKNASYRIKKTNRLKGKEMNLAVDLICKMILQGGRDVLFSHTPEYGLRVYKRDNLFFQTSISLSSENWNLMYPGTLLDFDWLSLDEELKDAVTKWLPKK